MKSNKAVSYAKQTHEGGRAFPHQKPIDELERAVCVCLLFEDTFYEKGNRLAERIAELCRQVSLAELAALAIKARIDMKLRHVPLFLLVQLIKLASERKQDGHLVSLTIQAVIQRPDEMGELLSLYWGDRKPGDRKRPPLANALKRGLALAFTKFKPYQLAKWNRDAAIKLKDVMFLVHPIPADLVARTDEEIHRVIDNTGFVTQVDRKGYKRGPVDRHTIGQGAVWSQLIAGTLAAPDTWEVALSGGADKKETFTRLLEEKKLGYIALLMNLRNMAEVGVEQALVERSILDGAKGSKALPFRFLSAAGHAPQYAQALSDAMESCVEGELKGSSVLLIDVSGSMNSPLSKKGTMMLYEAAAALAVLVRGVSKSCRVFAYNDQLMEVANLRGLALVDGIRRLVRGGTRTASAVSEVNKRIGEGIDRFILITDEQAHDGLIQPKAKQGYLINVGPYAPALDLEGRWIRFTGWSERVVEWIQLEESRSVEL